MEDDNSNNNNNGGDETPQIPLSSHDNHDPDQYIQYPNFFFNSPLTPSNDNPLMNPLSSLINQQQQQLLHDTNIDWVTLFSSTNPNSTNNSLGSIFGDHNQSNQLLPLSSSSLSPLAGMAASSSSTSSAVTRLEGEEENGAGGNNKENKLGKVMTSRSKKRVNRPTRFAFQTRSADDILDDGFRWRKYGQKAVKNSIYPRSYYRCTHHTCNVKKQIQRLSKDTGIVVTTYEGVHNHPCEKLMESLTPLLRQMQFLSRF